LVAGLKRRGEMDSGATRAFLLQPCPDAFLGGPANALVLEVQNNLQVSSGLYLSYL